MRKQKISLNAIAIGMGRVGSTLSRELKRNSGQRGYRHSQADRMAKQRHHDKPKAIKLDEEMQQLITPLIQEKWSPEQVSGRLKREGKKSVSHETIYRFLLTDKSRRRVGHALVASSQALWQERLSRHYSSPRGY
jgi:IS30 family transposase